MICSRCKKDAELDPRGEDAPYPIGYKVVYYGGQMCVDCCASELQEHAEMRVEVDRIKAGGAICRTCNDMVLFDHNPLRSGRNYDVCVDCGSRN